MRPVFSAVLFGLALCAAAPVWAQNNTATTNPYMVPLYNGAGSTAYSTQNGQAPVYNNTGAPFPMEQMIAGKNAPSYNYNRANSRAQASIYGGNYLSGGNGGALTPQEAEAIRAQRNAQAQAYQAEYMASLQQQAAMQAQQNGVNSSLYQGSQFSNLYSSSQGEGAVKKPTQRRVIYKEKNDPLVTPPPLFNLDR